MGIDRLLKSDGLKERERALLKTVKGIMENPEKIAAKIPEFENLQEKCAAVSARQKLFGEMAADCGKDSLTGQVGRHLFVSGDAQIQNRILCAEKSLEECGRYIMKQAENMAKKGKRKALCVTHDVVYGWAEDYFRAENIKDSDLILQFPAARGSGKEVLKKDSASAAQSSVKKKKPEKHKASAEQMAKAGKRTDVNEEQRETDQAVAGTEKKTDGENRQLSLFDICPS